MFMKKKTAAPASQPVAVTVEPRPGHTDQEVVDRLVEQDARLVSVLAPGFISAQVAPTKFQALESIALVHPKPRKQTR